MRQAKNVKFDLERGPISHFSVVRVSPELHFVAITMHHIVADGWSLSIAVRDFAAQYSALASQKMKKLVDLPLQYVDYAAWEGEQIRAGLFDSANPLLAKETRGRAEFARTSPNRSSTAADTIAQGRSDSSDYRLDLAEEIDRYSLNRDVTPFMTILAALQVLLHRISGQDDIVIGTPVANRGVRTRKRDWPFVNSLRCYVNLCGQNPTFNEFLNEVRQVTIDAIDNRDIPFDLVVEAVNPRRALGHAPIFQVMFALHNFPIQEPGSGISSAQLLRWRLVTARFDLTSIW